MNVFSQLQSVIKKVPDYTSQLVALATMSVLETVTEFNREVPVFHYCLLLLDVS